MYWYTHTHSEVAVYGGILACIHVHKRAYICAHTLSAGCRLWLECSCVSSAFSRILVRSKVCSKVCVLICVLLSSLSLSLSLILYIYIYIHIYISLSAYLRLGGLHRERRSERRTMQERARRAAQVGWGLTRTLLHTLLGRKCHISLSLVQCGKKSYIYSNSK